MRDALGRINPVLRAHGFRRAGQTFRKRDRDFVFVVNFQKSRWGDRFYVNLGVQPLFVPAEGDASVDTLKEYECVLRRRVGQDWPCNLTDEDCEQLLLALNSSARSFFKNALTLPDALPTLPADELIQAFSSGTTSARAALHLARAAEAKGFNRKASELALAGIGLAGPQASGLVAELRALNERLSDSAHDGAIHRNGVR